MSKDRTSTPQKNKIINSAIKWVITITLFSFIISMLFSYISTKTLDNVNNIVAFIVLLIFIIIGIIFDAIGVAATSGDEKPFHSMAARKVNGAKEAVWLINNAEKVASICNDVVGDISGILSGATGAIIIARITTSFSAVSASMIIQLIITGSIAALIIGGKAAGKGIAIKHSSEMLFIVGKIIHFLPFVNFNKR